MRSYRNSKDFEAPCSDWQVGDEDGAGALLTLAASGRDDAERNGQNVWRHGAGSHG